MQGALYTRDFLERGIREEPAWVAVTDEELAAIRAKLEKLFGAFPINHKPNEGVTERDLIYPVLGALGWSDLLVQQQISARRRLDVPDALLFADASHKGTASAEKDPANRYRQGLALVEAKRWQRPLDRADPQQGAPSSQMLRYLRRADDASDGRLEWGILTNGRHWRLYWQGARSRAEEFLEIDLPACLGLKGFPLDLFAAGADADHWLRVFVLMFRRASFLPEGDARHSFHVEALRETRKWEAKVAEGLSEQVFGEVFPALVRSIGGSVWAAAGKRPLTEAELEDVRRAALTLLYRLLFVLFAEDRRLLPIDHEGYAAYSLDRLRDEIAERLDRNEVLSDRADTRYGTLRALFSAIDGGDAKLGLPPYNGGLFDPAEHPLLETVRLPDSVIALAVDTLSRRDEGGRKLRINYRDLSVQQLGSIYERLLEFAVVPDADHVAAIRPNVFARKGSGSYYTPEELVGLIVERTVGPLLDERQRAFDEALARLKSERGPKAERLAALRDLDPAASFLSLRVCDPAMGSGHFLVTLVDMLADRTLATMADAEAKAAAAFGEDAGYRSPLQERIEEVRERILTRAKEEGWRVAEGQLDDRHIVRRTILKRTVYGVDKNPMAVELAKVSLWLHTFTVGAPLSFLDHHLRCGDSLFGELVRPVEDWLHARGSLALAAPLRDAKRAVVAMATVEEMSDADLAEVARSETSFAEVARETAPLAAFLNFFHALRWLDRLPTIKAKGGKAKKIAGQVPKSDSVSTILDGALGDPVRVVAGQSVRDAARHADAVELINKARVIAARERFLHWQVAFPGVWEDWESAAPRGGFDAVIGNPPWDRIKIEDVEWFAIRRPDIARLEKAADRRRVVGQLKRADDPLYREYELAQSASESAVRVARDNGSYPLLSGGDINLYSLFVERAHALTKPDGMVGLLVPSGIASDLTASAFFRKIATAGRLHYLLDFLNKSASGANFFPDVYYRFKFCAFIAGGPRRQIQSARCGFYLRDVDEVHDPERVFVLDRQDFEAVNPNTGTTPIFRTRREAEITKSIHARLPVLMDRRANNARAAWPVRYRTLLHMANDSAAFRSRGELEKEGVYPVDGGLLRRGSKEYLPLYEGKMVQAFDHRAGDIVLATGNLF